MKDPWNTRQLGVYPTCLLLIVLIAGAVSLLAVAFGFHVEDVLLAATITVMIVGTLFTLLYVIVRMALRWFRRAHTDRIVISHIANLVRQKLPLAQGLQIAASSERGIARRHLDAIAVPLSAGFSLAESIRIGWPECPGLVLSLILAGERTGQLAMAVEQAEHYLIHRTRSRPGGGTDPVLPYALAVTCTTCLITTGIMIAVVPKFKEIFKDYGAQMPPRTIALIGIADWCTYNGLPLLFLLLLAMFAGVYLSFRPRRVPTPLFSSWVADWIRWHTPGIGRLEWSRGLAVGLQALRMGLHAGLGLPESARLASEVDVNTKLRSRLEQFANLTESGCELREAAHRAGLGQVAGLALASGYRGQNMDAAIRYAADYHEALISRWWLVFRSMAWPVTTLALGTMVAFVVVSLFEPLVSLIDQTMRYTR